MDSLHECDSGRWIQQHSRPLPEWRIYACLHRVRLLRIFQGGTAEIQALTLEEDTTAPNGGQPLGGGFNSTVSAGRITLATPLAPGASINVHFLLGVQQGGSFRFFVNVEALP